ncbi:hypothetical protein [Parvularcula sp. LCG005]|uniref:hypothetical protein n=1 Tax=Parvularcula sp. LCG005 TaxID=3078805 RepID=UPI0029428809|nr:hypothetical protein [Parvularcula sp. LCG005]WOI52550.1 hypothetical protein RUI03_10365 [Parvularcula sp. LCG005]
MSMPQVRSSRFTFTSWQVLDGQASVAFSFHCDQFGDFTETVSWPVAPEELAQYFEGGGRAIGDLLWVALGVSYYKAGAARHIDLPPLPAAGRAMAEALYTEGLAEFFVRAELPYPADIEFSGPVTDDTLRRPDRVEPGAALVAFGGGKDSYVARAILQQAGEDMRLVSATLSGAVQSVLRATAPDEITFIERALDASLAGASAAGFNGHVPITAINMLLLSVLGAIKGYPQVVFANERSADEPTMKMGTVVANHQFSKSGPFETHLRQAMLAADPDTPRPYSILRPYSEAWIGRAFARLKAAHPKFTSCNRNFRLAGDAEKRWCGRCAKCAFTSLILAPYLNRQEAKVAFGAAFLDAPELLSFYEELCGLTDHKPWDCVGTIDECRASLWRASQSADWQDSLAVTQLLPKVSRILNDEELESIWLRALEPDDGTLVPATYLRAGEDLSR